MIIVSVLTNIGFMIAAFAEDSFILYHPLMDFWSLIRP
jgi:hypothetical protein